MAPQLAYWEPEDRLFWAREGAQVARRNLLISIPALVLSFAVWMVWSVVVVQLPHIGFHFSANQLFWLAALPGLAGGTLRPRGTHVKPLAEIEKATLRLVAIRSSRNVSAAAARLGMAPVSLSRWIGRRTLPPMPAASASIRNVG